MYLKLNNGVVEKYPYSIGDLRKDNPQTSFPNDISETLLEEWGVFPVFKTPAPEASHDKNVSEGTPENRNNQWFQTWVVSNATAQEIANRVAQKADEVREERNKLIKQSDWTMLVDAPFSDTKKAEWVAYRQSLRDIPQQSGFPFAVNWPTNP